MNGELKNALTRNKCKAASKAKNQKMRRIAPTVRDLKLFHSCGSAYDKPKTDGVGEPRGIAGDTAANVFNLLTEVFEANDQRRRVDGVEQVLCVVQHHLLGQPNVVSARVDAEVQNLSQMSMHIS